MDQFLQVLNGFVFPFGILVLLKCRINRVTFIPCGVDDTLHGNYFSSWCGALLRSEIMLKLLEYFTSNSSPRELMRCRHGLLYSRDRSLASQCSWARMVKASYRLSTHLTTGSPVNKVSLKSKVFTTFREGPYLGFLLVESSDYNFRSTPCLQTPILHCIVP